MSTWAAEKKLEASIRQQQHQLNALRVAPPPKRIRIADASVTPPVKKWTHWECSCEGKNVHPVAHPTCFRCSVTQVEQEKELLKTPRSKAKVTTAPAPAAPVFLFKSPPGPPPVPQYAPPKHMVVTIASSGDDFPVLNDSLQSRVNNTQISGPVITAL